MVIPYHWLSLESLVVMIVATFHHSCMNFPVHLSDVVVVNIVVDIPL